jgi:hypothetical protein
MKRRPTEPRMRTVVRLLALLCKRIDRLEARGRTIRAWVGMRTPCFRWAGWRTRRINSLFSSVHVYF